MLLLERRALLVLLLFVGLACGGGNEGPSGPNTPNPPAGNTVVMGASSFVPNALTIAVNESVTWSNTSGILHNVVFSTGGAPANIPNHTSGTTERTFTAAGTFAYDCTNHAGMSGTVTVE